MYTIHLEAGEELKATVFVDGMNIKKLGKRPEDCWLPRN
jgi:hypothetical protein